MRIKKKLSQGTISTRHCVQLHGDCGALHELWNILHLLQMIDSISIPKR